jgi:hypothetical protein
MTCDLRRRDSNFDHTDPLTNTEVTLALAYGLHCDVDNPVVTEPTYGLVFTRQKCKTVLGREPIILVRHIDNAVIPLHSPIQRT